MTQSSDDQLPFFVYGTLIPGQPNDTYWSDAILSVEPAVFSPGRLFDFGSFPMLVESRWPDGGGQVSGRLVHVSAEPYGSILAAIDGLEDYDPANEAASIYRRVARDVSTAAGETVRAWVYIGRESFAQGRPVVTGGDWVAYCDRQNRGEDMAGWWRKNGLDLFFGKIFDSD